MKVEEVPQELNRTLGGHRKGVYARDESGRMVLVPCQGWEVEEIVTTQAVEHLHEQADAARERGRKGISSPLEYWMYACRMDVDLLAQTSGVWRWRIRRHLQPQVFARLSPRLLARYAQALGLSCEQLRSLP